MTMLPLIREAAAGQHPLSLLYIIAGTRIINGLSNPRSQMDTEVTKDRDLIIRAGQEQKLLYRIGKILLMRFIKGILK